MMPIVITTETEEKILEKMESGRYASADDVIGEALRLLDEHEQMQSLRAAVAEGLEGEPVPLTRVSWMEAWERARVRAGIAETDDVPPKPADAPRRDPSGSCSDKGNWFREERVRGCGL